MKLFFEWLRRRARLIALLILSMAIAAAGGALYHMPAGAIIYPLILSAAIWIAAGIIDFLRTRARHYELRKIIDQQAALVSRLPDADTIPESDYADMVDGLRRTIADMRTQADARYNDAIDYFTAWAHQIKTPIASMCLNLQNEDTPLSRRLESDLFRIGQYADMVLAFLRMGSESTDYLFRECDLDGIIRASVKKFAGEFILRRLSLSYEGTNARAVTDEKWLGFILEQLLSNALKYTRTGGITISVQDQTIIIRDTGIGIAPQDLPRIFEKGYTGKNGRDDRAASGLGLYLCKTISQRIGADLSIESQLNIGTTCRLSLHAATAVL